MGAFKSLLSCQSLNMLAKTGISISENTQSFLTMILIPNVLMSGKGKRETRKGV